LVLRALRRRVPHLRSRRGKPPIEEEEEGEEETKNDLFVHIEGRRSLA